ncbi:MAG: triose-phosphate isomerase [Kiritimatiellaeota bacterium]|nr:triose-phosphate isomerase [Kiritimatiellota bacterium]
MRVKIVAGNWKMNKTASETAALIDEIIKATAGTHVEVVVCPPFTSLKDAAAACTGSHVKLGAQNVHWEVSGAYTGEVSAEMLKELGVTHVIIGHSERRQYFGETDETVNKRTKAALAAGLVPIVCVGETLEERDSGKMDEVIVRQVKLGLTDLDVGKVVIAYEPVWAIGTGRTATPAQAQEAHALIRRTLAEIVGGAIANSVRIQYGGSMKPDNAKELMGQPDIDGGLIGGAALKADSFAAIVNG